MSRYGLDLMSQSVVSIRTIDGTNHPEKKLKGFLKYQKRIVKKKKLKEFWKGISKPLLHGLRSNKF